MERKLKAPRLNRTWALPAESKVHALAACGRAIRSDLDFPRLRRATGRGPAIELRARRAPWPETRSFYRCRTEDRTVWLEVLKSRNGYLLRFPRETEFMVALDGRRIEWFAWPGIPRHVVRRQFLDQVLPRVLSLDGEIMLHASAIAAGQGALVFLGNSGAGKSTIAAAMAAKGMRFLGDDALRIEMLTGGFRVWPSHPASRLEPATARAIFGRTRAVADLTGKATLTSRTATFDWSTRPCPLRALLVLAPRPASAALSIRTLPFRRAMMELVRQTVRLDPAECAAEEFNSLANLAARIPMGILAVPRRLDRLENILHVVNEWLRDHDHVHPR